MSNHVSNQQRAQLNNAKQNIEIIYGETTNFNQFANAHVVMFKTIGKADNADIAISSIENFRFFYSKEASLSTTGDSEKKLTNL